MERNQGNKKKKKLEGRATCQLRKRIPEYKSINIRIHIEQQVLYAENPKIIIWPAILKNWSEFIFVLEELRDR